MKLAFLFLPFVGTRDYSTYSFHVNGKRFTPKSIAESCALCHHVRKISHESYKYLGTVHSSIVTHECNIRKNKSWKFLTSYDKHPCDSYHEKGKLKKL